VVCCRVLQRVAVRKVREHDGVFECGAVHCSALQRVAARCSALQRVAVRGSAWQWIVVRTVRQDDGVCSALQDIAVRQYDGKDDESYVRSRDSFMCMT